MEQSLVADLEAELGCLEPGLPAVGPNRDHGTSEVFFEPPSQAIYRLNPPSKTKSIHTFGDNGTLAWATPAGELVSVARCIGNKLVGVEYKKSIERGAAYTDRATTLRKVVNFPQGTGYSMGLSLDLDLRPVNMSYIHNRWPRFFYQHNALDIRLQYYVDSHRVVQQYQVRNNGPEEDILPFIVSSDICFWEQKDARDEVRPVPTSRSPDRLLLFQNSEVLVRNTTYKAHLRMTLFHNTQRISLWADKRLGIDEENNKGGNDTHDTDKEVKRTEGDLQDILINKRGLPFSMNHSLKRTYHQHYDRDARRKQSQPYQTKNFAEHRDKLTLPGLTTQELCIIIHLEDILPDDIACNEPGLGIIDVPSNMSSLDEVQPDMDQMRQLFYDIEKKESLVIAEYENLRQSAANLEHHGQIHNLVGQLIRLGSDHVKLRWIGEARYYYHFACLVAESFSMEDLLISKTRYEYASFLDRNGWHSTSLKILDEAFQALSSKGFVVVGDASQWIDTLGQLALMYLTAKSFSKAEILYTQALTQLNRDTATYNLESATLLERIAYSQACQGTNIEAEKTYTSLLATGFAREVTLLTNLGLVSRRQCHSRDVQAYYERALDRVRTEAEKSAYDSWQSAIIDPQFDDSLPKTDRKAVCSVKELIALSGLFSCVQTELRADHEQLHRISAYWIGYVNLNNLLFCKLFRRSPFGEGVFNFAMARHLESLLSVFSIPVKGINGYSGIAFINAITPYCTCEGRSTLYIDVEGQDDTELKIDNLSRIREICEGHLVWIFKIADSKPTWSRLYAIDGAQVDYVQNPLLSLATEGAFQFLKLCLYYNVWTENWEFLLDFLHSKLKQWLEYLDHTKHMNNLWVEDLDTETFKPYDTLSADGGYITREFPHYDLSDAAVVWLALSQLDKLIASIENRSVIVRAQADRVREVRQWLKSHQDTLSPQQIRSSILKTFTIPKDDVIIESIPHSEASVSSLTDGPQSITAGIFDSSATLNEQRVRFEGPLQARSTGGNAKQIMVFQRKINGCVPDMQPTDFPIMEAANMGIFAGSRDEAHNAWKETLKLQRDHDRYVLRAEDPRHVALTLLASKLRLKYGMAGMSTLSVSGRYKRLEDALLERLATAVYDSGFYAPIMVDDAPRDILYWPSGTFETMSLLIGSLFEICREVLPYHHQISETPSSPNAFSVLMARYTPQTRITLMMPGPLEMSSRMSHENVNNQGVLPDWMYYHPDFIHKNPLNVDVRKELEILTSVRGLESAIATWKETESFHIGETFLLPFEPTVTDSGMKTRSNDKASSAERQINIQSYYGRDSFWERLLEARSPERAKKRLVEVSSYDKGSVMACWLSAPNSERPLLMDFFRRHDLSESFFGERGHWLGNLWDTELHLGFYQLLDDRHPERSSLHSAINSDQVLSLSGATRGRKIVHVVMSFRFNGDLRGRFWTCNFLSSVIHGFQSLVDEHYEHSSKGEDDFYTDKQGQRKILEMIYVERALSEMKNSTDDILAAYKVELEELKTAVQQEDNLELTHNLSSPHLKAASTLGEVLQQLDSSLSVLEQMGKREDTSGLRSGWSYKNQRRHGEKLQVLNTKCKAHVRVLRMQQSLLKEQRRIAEWQHSDLQSYKQLLEARQSSANVRAFTYVTIVFLPLSFSSSLFSMAGTPTHSTVYVMVPTTVIALMITFLLVANLKLMDRHWSWRMDKMNTITRKKMRAGQSNFWNKVSTDLELTNQRNFVVHYLTKGLPAESQWYYTIFWLKCALESPLFYVRAGVRARQAYSEKAMSSVLFALKTLAALFFIPFSVLIFLVHEIIMTAADTIYLLLVLARQLFQRTLKSPKKQASIPVAPGEEMLQAAEMIELAKYKPEKLAREGFSKLKALTFGLLCVAMDAILQLLESPPRPIRDYVDKLNPSTEDTLELLSTGSAASRDSEGSESLRERREVKKLSPPQAIEKERESSVIEDSNLKRSSDEDDEDVVTTDNPRERPQRLKKLLGRSRKPDVGTQEPQMRVGWLV